MGWNVNNKKGDSLMLKNYLKITPLKQNEILSKRVGNIGMRRKLKKL
jgi:hypothetical protein